jgi:NADH:ubiquinone oxidoreductase subunit D
MGIPSGKIMKSHFKVDCASDQLIRSAQEEERRHDRQRLVNSARFNQRSMSQRIYKVMPETRDIHSTFVLTLAVEGRSVMGAEAEIGWYHQGIEKVLESSSWGEADRVFAHVSPTRSSALNIAYQIALEKLYSAPVVSLRTRLERVIGLESERMRRHFQVIARMVELILEAPMDMTGESESRIAELRCNRKLERRLLGCAKVDRLSAISLGLTGPVLRAAGLADDLRTNHADLPYSLLDFVPQTRNECDAHARFLVRLDEIEHSGLLIRRASKLFEDLAQDDAITRFETPGAGTLASAFLEAPEGELAVTLCSAGEAQPYRARIKTPSFSLASALSAFLIGADIDDVTLIVTSLGIDMLELDR